MPRNQEFHPSHEPFSHHNISLVPVKITGPLAFLNPTRARFQPVNPPGNTTVQFQWTSRNNRKGRHRLVVIPPPSSTPGQAPLDPLAVISNTCETLEATTHWRPVFHTFRSMATSYPIWDISWLVAYMFTWGSAIWVLNGLFTFLPLAKPSWAFSDEALIGGGVTAFVGTCVFEIGSVLLLLEAVNTNREGCFGWAVQQAWREGHMVWRFVPDLERCSHHQHYHKSLLGPYPGVEGGEKAVDKRYWSWCPS